MFRFVPLLPSSRFSNDFTASLDVYSSTHLLIIDVYTRLHFDSPARLPNRRSVSDSARDLDFDPDDKQKCINLSYESQIRAGQHKVLCELKPSDL